MSAKDSEKIYFVAAKQFLGDQRPSYNHDLKFALRIGENRGYPESQDIILEGERASVSLHIYGQNNPEPNDQVCRFSLFARCELSDLWVATI